MSEQRRLEAQLNEAQTVTIDLNTPRRGTIWLQVWESCGKCVTAEYAIDTERGKVNVLGVTE